MSETGCNRCAHRLSLGFQHRVQWRFTCEIGADLCDKLRAHEIFEQRPDREFVVSQSYQPSPMSASVNSGNGSITV
ncbi:MAG: hypothetical protein AAB263_00050 [Planctomycetota bacterium]